MQARRRNSPSATPCPRCRRLNSVDAARCSNCGLPRPNFFRQLPIVHELLLGDVTFADKIVLACFVLFGLALALDFSGVQLAGGLLSMLAPSPQSLYKLGSGGLYPILQGRFWTLVTAMYLHGGILHIGFNMLWLRQIGPLVEDLFGASRFWIIYTLAGIAGGVLTSILGTPLYVGASGAIFGLFAALIYYGRSRGGTFGSGIMRTMLIWAGISFALGFLMSGVDNWGHLGGFIAGLATAWVVGYQEKKPQGLYSHLTAAALLLVVAAAFVMMLVSFFRGGGL